CRTSRGRWTWGSCSRTRSASAASTAASCWAGLRMTTLARDHRAPGGDDRPLDGRGRLPHPFAVRGDTRVQPDTSEAIALAVQRERVRRPLDDGADRALDPEALGLRVDDVLETRARRRDRHSGRERVRVAERRGGTAVRVEGERAGPGRDEERLQDEVG